MFRLTEKLVNFARLRAQELKEIGEIRGLVQESPQSPSFLLSSDEADVIVLQRIEVDGSVFFLGLSK